MFKSAGAGAGSKFENIKDGLYKGKLLRFEEGPTFYNTRDLTDAEKEQYGAEGKPQPKVRWVWELQDLQGNSLNEEMTELTSDATGERSTAAKYFTAHLGRQFDNKVHNVDDTMTECLGKTVMLSISTKPTGYKKVDVFPANN